MKYTDKSYDTSTIKLMYRLGLLLVIPLLLAFIFMHTDLARDILLRGGRQCSIYKATGVPCPGCGGTRAAFLLAYFHIIESIRFNAAVFAGALLYVIFMAVETLHFMAGLRGLSERGFFIMFYTWVAVCIGHWIYKITLLFTH